MSTPDRLTVACWLQDRHGLHVFAVDHPGRPECGGSHRECDGQRGKHPRGQWPRLATLSPRLIRAPLVACLALAAELAAKWEIVPFGAPDTDTWLSLLASEEQRDNRPEMALDIVREYIAAHSDKLWGGPPKGDQAAGGDERPPSTGGSVVTCPAGSPCSPRSSARN